MNHVKHHSLLNEYLYKNEVSSGIKCYVVPKENFKEKQGMITVNYGAIDNEFELDGKIKKMPVGIAHFLEHKLFEDESLNIFKQFSNLGATANAFTSFTNTAYYFNCTENFYDSLELLLDFVQTPYFTDENVEKEKNIINQEINMYDDDPSWVVYLNMLKGLYNNKQYKQNIAGSTQSIKKITKEMLLDCYNYFYTPTNMAVVCCGDIEPETVFKIVEQKTKNKASHEVKRFQEKESNKIHKKLVKDYLSVSTPLFYFGFKDNDFDTPIMKKTAGTKILLDMIAGESSSFCEDMYTKGLIDRRFQVEYIANMFFANSIFLGFSKDWEYVKDSLIKEIERLRTIGIDNNHFERIKNKYIGRFIRGFNSIDAIATSQTDYFSKNTDLFEALDMYINLKKEDVEQLLQMHLHEDNMTVSVVMPEKSFFA